MREYNEQGAEKNMNLESIKDRTFFFNEERVHILLLQ